MDHVTIIQQYCIKESKKFSLFCGCSLLSVWDFVCQNHRQ